MNKENIKEKIDNENKVNKKIERQVLDRVETLIYNITKGMPFYAAILSRFKKEISYKIPIAAVGFKNAYPILYINPIGFSSYRFREQVFIGIHEIIHITNMHHFRGKGKDPGVWNIACDVEINQLIQSDIADLPNDCLLPHHFDLEEGLSAEAYYNILIERKDQIELPESLAQTLLGDLINGEDKEDGSQGGNSSDGESDSEGEGSGKKSDKAPGFEKLHPHWDEMSKENEDLHKGLIKEIVANAQTKSRGNIPGEMQSIIEELFEPQLDWPRLLGTFLASVRSSSYRYTWSRPNRRFGKEKMGKIRNKHSNLIVAIDTSASLNEEELALFLTELNHLKKSNDVDITVIQCDWDIQSVQDWDDIDIDNFEVKGRGGTSFLPVFELIEKRELGTFTLKNIPDGVIYFTDGGGEAPQHSVIRTLWVISPGGRTPYDRTGSDVSWGESIFLDK